MSDGPPHKHEDASEEDEELDETAFKPIRDAVLFAIDISKSMLQAPQPSESKKADTDSPAIAALKCAYQLMEQRIISNPRDMMGILLYGSRESKFIDEESGNIPYPHCYLLQDLNIPGAEDVRNLRDIVTDDEVAAELLQPCDKPVSMSNVLFCANQIFTTRAPNFSSRRLFVVTDNDSPHGESKTLRQAAAVRARDLYDLGVQIEIFPIQQPGDIVYHASPQDPEAVSLLEPQASASASSPDGISLLSSLLSSVTSKTVPKRAMFSRMPLEFGPDLTISVNGYLLLKRQTPQRSCYIWQGGEKPQIVRGKTILKAEDLQSDAPTDLKDAPEVPREDVQRAYTFGGEQVVFTPDEQKQLRFFGKPVIRILGFKPLADLPFWASIKPATFIYPTETGFVGSTRVFAALWQTLLARERWALTWFIARTNAKPRLAAMLAAREKLDDGGHPAIPAGMWLIPLPFVDDIRPNPPAPYVPAPPSLVEKMSVIVEQLLLPGGEYKPQRYPNPALQYHYKIVQAIALDEDLPAKPVDRTVPKYRQIDKRAGPYVLEWAAELERVHAERGLDRRDGRQVGTVAKRRAVGGGEESEGSGRAKKVKTESASEHASSEEDITLAFRASWAKGKLARHQVGELRRFLAVHGEVAGRDRKAELVAKAEQVLDRLYGSASSLS